MMNPKRKGMYGGVVFIGLAIALLLDLKYKGLFYRMICPKKVQS